MRDRGAEAIRDEMAPASRRTRRRNLVAGREQQDIRLPPELDATDIRRSRRNQCGGRQQRAGMEKHIACAKVGTLQANMGLPSRVGVDLDALRPGLATLDHDYPIGAIRERRARHDPPGIATSQFAHSRCAGETRSGLAEPRYAGDKVGAADGIAVHRSTVAARGVNSRDDRRREAPAPDSRQRRKLAAQGRGLRGQYFKGAVERDRDETIRRKWFLPFRLFVSWAGERGPPTSRRSCTDRAAGA